MQPSSLDAVKALAAASRLAPAEAATLLEGLTFQLHLQQALRIASGDQFDPPAASEGLRRWLANHMGLKEFSALDARLSQIQTAVAALRGQKLGPLSTEDAPRGV